MLRPGERLAKAPELMESFNRNTLEGFKSHMERNDLKHIDISDIPGTFGDGVLWKRSHIEGHGLMRIPLTEINKVLEAGEAAAELLIETFDN